MCHLVAPPEGQWMIQAGIFREHLPPPMTRWKSSSWRCRLDSAGTTAPLAALFSRPWTESRRTASFLCVPTAPSSFSCAFVTWTWLKGETWTPSSPQPRSWGTRVCFFARMCLSLSILRSAWCWLWGRTGTEGCSLWQMCVRGACLRCCSRWRPHRWSCRTPCRGRRLCSPDRSCFCAWPWRMHPRQTGAGHFLFSRDHSICSVNDGGGGGGDMSFCCCCCLTTLGVLVTYFLSQHPNSQPHQRSVLLHSCAYTYTSNSDS